MRALILTAAASLLHTAGAAADPVHVEMPASVTWGYGSDASLSMQGVVEGEPLMETPLGERTSLTLSARIRLDWEDRLDPGRPDFSNYAGPSRPLALGTTGMAELRDVYLEHRLDNGLLRFGKQQIVWGRLDGIKVLDTLNPQDFREFILDDFDQSRISLWSAYADLSLGGWRTELAWIPDATAHAIPREDAWFALSAPRFRFGATGGASPPLVTDRPPGGIDSSAAGLRLSRQLGALDMSAVAYTGLDFEPLGRVRSRDGAPVVERFYERRELFGASAEASFGALAVRAEYAWQPDRVFNTRADAELGTVALDQHRAAIAVDVDAPLDLFVNLQFLLDRVEQAPASLVRPARDRIVTAFVRRTFGYETLDLELRWYRSLDDHDDLVSASLAYTLGDNTEVELRAEFFSGPADGLFGQFAGRDRVTLGLSRTF